LYSEAVDYYLSILAINLWEMSEEFLGYILLPLSEEDCLHGHGDPVCSTVNRHIYVSLKVHRYTVFAL
jgi:hypothetical protein